MGQEEAIAEAAALAVRLNEIMHEQKLSNAQAFLALAMALDSVIQDVCATMPASAEGVRVVRDTLRELTEASSVSTSATATSRFLIDVATGIVVLAEGGGTVS